ncbi:hypothetical protein ZWY2020_012870 [Hordeum vulgare]|nr:hypothetical protein ZWY2020_012870 [Hordeum vulgare]
MNWESDAYGIACYSGLLPSGTTCLSSCSRSLLPAAVRVMRLFCQPMPMSLHVSQDCCTSLWRSVTGHFALHGCSHALWRARRAIVPPIFRSSTRIIIYREFEYETVPYTNRTHKVLFSPRRVRRTAEHDFANFKKEHASKILDPHHHQSVRVHAIGSKIIRAIRRGLSIKSKLEQRGQEPPQMVTCLDWIDDLNWEVIVIEDKFKKAACFAGGGKIVVYTGLLDHFSTDAEVATVIAHEVGHVIARHSIEMIKIFTLCFPTRLLVTPLLQRHELEADYIGMLLLAAAGFDPHAAPLLFEKLERIKGQSVLTKLLCFFQLKAHPSRRRRAWLLSQPKVMEEAMKLYREATSDDGPDKA